MSGKFDLKDIGTVRLAETSVEEIPVASEDQAVVAFDGSTLVLKTIDPQENDVITRLKVEDRFQVVSGFDDFTENFETTWSVVEEGGAVVTQAASDSTYAMSVGVLNIEVDTESSRGSVNRVFTGMRRSLFPTVMFRFAFPDGGDAINWGVGLLDQNGIGYALYAMWDEVEEEANYFFAAFDGFGEPTNPIPVVLPELSGPEFYVAQIVTPPGDDTGAQLYLGTDSQSLVLAATHEDSVGNVWVHPWIQALTAAGAVANRTMTVDWVYWKCSRFTPGAGGGDLHVQL